MMVWLSHHASLRLVMIGGVLWAVTTGLGCADRAASPQAGAPIATIVAVEGASTNQWC
jgi:hypothetical protein